MRPSARAVRGIAVVLTWSIWLAALVLAVKTDVSQAAVAGLGVFGFVPYLLSLHVIEPRLDRK